MHTYSFNTDPTEQAEAAYKSSVLPHNYHTDRGICTSETQAAKFQ